MWTLGQATIVYAAKEWMVNVMSRSCSVLLLDLLQTLAAIYFASPIGWPGGCYSV